MAFAIKAEVKNPRAETFSFEIQCERRNPQSFQAVLQIH